MGIIMARTTMNLNYNDGSYLQGHPVHPTDYIFQLDCTGSSISVGEADGPFGVQ